MYDAACDSLETIGAAVAADQIELTAHFRQRLDERVAPYRCQDVGKIFWFEPMQNRSGEPR